MEEVHSERTSATMATTEQVQEALQQLQARESTFHARSSSNLSSQWWTRCTASGRSCARRKMKSELSEAEQAESKAAAVSGVEQKGPSNI